MIVNPTIYWDKICCYYILNATIQDVFFDYILLYTKGTLGAFASEGSCSSCFCKQIY